MVQEQCEDMVLHGWRCAWAAFDAGEKTLPPSDALSWQAAGLTRGRGCGQELQI